MTFPQTSSVVATTGGQEYWRLFTQPESSGDIWESDVGARAFLIGPESDIARAAVTYLDPQELDSVNTVEFSTTKPFVGRIDSFLDQEYPAGLPVLNGAPQPFPARLLITLKDLLPPFGWVPAEASATVFVDVTQPLIDIYQFLQDEPSFLGQRSDKIYRYTFGKGSLEDFTELWFAVPYYGRRLAQVTASVQSGVAATGDLTIYGVNFSNVQDGGAGAINANIDTTIQLDTDAGGTADTEVTSSGRPFDYLVVQAEPTGTGDALAISILVSDELG